MKRKLNCAECGCEIKDKYYTCSDYLIISNYFGKTEDNIFCSQECLNKAMNIEILEDIEKVLKRLEVSDENN